MQTIFLATTGQHVILGRGAVAMQPETRTALAAQNLRGWVVVITGNLHGRRPPVLAWIETIGADDAERAAAVVAFMAARA